MPRSSRSKSRTPKKERVEQVGVPEDSLESLETEKSSENKIVMTEKELTPQSPATRRRRTRSSSGGADNEALTSSHQASTSPRQRRTLSASADSPSNRKVKLETDEHQELNKTSAKKKKKKMIEIKPQVHEEPLEEVTTLAQNEGGPKSATDATSAVEETVDTQESDKAPLTRTEKRKSANANKSKTIDVKVHRVRHLDYIPSPILDMASNGNSYLALSRQDGSVELIDVKFIPDYAGPNNKKWSPHLFPLAHIAGSKRAVANSIVWVNQKFLVAGSPDGTLWTVQFAGKELQLQSRIASGGGGVFDLCSFSCMVAAACQDGSVRIWKVNADDQGVHKIEEPPVATLSTAGAPVLSVAWQCSKQLGNTSYTEIYCGVADGTIRKYQVDLEISKDPAGMPIVRVLKHAPQLRMTVESRGRRASTKIWTMKALEDGTLATGNSLGQVQIWDTVTGTLIQSLNQTELKADVLKLEVNASQTKLFASGVDSRVVCLERTAGSTGSSWKYTMAQRPHTHDVKAMSMIQGPGGKAGGSIEALISGGVDTKVCSYVVSDFAKKRPQVCYPWPSQSPVSCSEMQEPQANQILSIHRENQIELFQLDSKLSPKERRSSFVKKESEKKGSGMSTSELIGEVALSTQSNLSLSAISPDGHWLAASNASRLFLFRLKSFEKTYDDDSGEEETIDIEPEKVILPRQFNHLAVTALHFRDSFMFVTDSSHRLFIIDLASETTTIKLVVVLPLSKAMVDIPIVSLKTSADGKYLVAMRKHSENSIHVLKKVEGKGVYNHYWTLPRLPGARPAAITMAQNGELAVATASFQVYMFDLEGQKLSAWSEKNKFPIEDWPSEISHRKDYPVRLITNPKDGNQLIMASFGAFVVIDLKGKLPRHCRMIPEAHVRRKRKWGRDEEALAAAAIKEVPIVFAPAKDRFKGQPIFDDPNARNCTVCLYYNSMLYLGFLGQDEMVVVEQPWLRVIATFPEALQRRVYGCN